MSKKLLTTLAAVLVSGFLFSSVVCATPINWVISPDANAFAFSVTTVNGFAQINSAEGGTQPLGIFGAGFLWSGSFAMDFDADLNTWDSYNSPTGPGTGYYDAFIVTASTAGYYWDSSPTDPILASSSTFVWGGDAWGDGTLETYITAPGSTDSISLVVVPLTDVYVSLVLDTMSLPHADDAYPSWGSFHVAPVPEPGTLLLLGSGLICLAFYGRRRKKQID